MKTLFNLLIAAVFVLALPVLAAEGVGTAQVAPAPTGQPTLQACPAPGQSFTLSQVSQADCCKGHKGVCGCRAGKIVCCDGTTSPNCTCHGDSGFEN